MKHYPPPANTPSRVRSGTVATFKSEICFEIYWAAMRENITRLKCNNNICFVCFQVSSDGNITYSTLTFTPTLADHGKTLTCRAVNKFIDAAVEEDSWKLNVFCKYDIRRYFYKTVSYSDTSLNVYFSSQIGMKAVRAVFQSIFEIVR